MAGDGAGADAGAGRGSPPRTLRKQAASLPASGDYCAIAAATGRAGTAACRGGSGIGKAVRSGPAELVS